MSEHLEDFTWEENKAFADLICEVFKTSEIERLEEMAGVMFE